MFSAIILQHREVLRNVTIIRYRNFVAYKSSLILNTMIVIDAVSMLTHLCHQIVSTQCRRCIETVSSLITLNSPPYKVQLGNLSKSVEKLVEEQTAYKVNGSERNDNQSLVGLLSEVLKRTRLERSSGFSGQPTDIYLQNKTLIKASYYAGKCNVRCGFIWILSQFHIYI